MVVFFFGVFIFFSCQVAEGCALLFFTFAADLPGRAEEGLFFEKKKSLIFLLTSFRGNGLMSGLFRFTAERAFQSSLTVI